MTLILEFIFLRLTPTSSFFYISSSQIAEACLIVNLLHLDPIDHGVAAAFSFDHESYFDHYSILFSFMSEQKKRVISTFISYFRGNFYNLFTFLCLFEHKIFGIESFNSTFFDLGILYWNFLDNFHAISFKIFLAKYVF